MEIIKYNKIYDNENNWTQSSNIINIFFLFLFFLIDKQNFLSVFLEDYFSTHNLDGNNANYTTLKFNLTSIFFARGKSRCLTSK